MFQQAYNLDIAVESDGPVSVTNGYNYEMVQQIVEAANATQSPVLVYWFVPDTLGNKFVGTESEMVPIILPTPTRKCIDTRPSTEERCSNDVKVRRGNKDSSCDSEAHALQKVIVSNLYKTTHKVPTALRSPAYDAVKAFQITDIDISQIFSYWKSRNVEEWGYDEKEAACKWVAQNMDKLAAFVPRTYPRSIEYRDAYNSALIYAALAFGVLSLLVVVITTALVHKFR